MDLTYDFLTALNSTSAQPTPQCSPVLKRKFEPKGTITNSNGVKNDIFSSVFKIEDIKIILNSNHFDIYEDYNKIYFKTKTISFECNKNLFLNSN
jgi:hypothetical protein